MNLSDLSPNFVVVAGDWHRNLRCSTAVAARLPVLLPDEMPRVVVHVGDFGIATNQYGQEYLTTLTRALADVDAYLLFVDGNHENHAFLRELAKGHADGEPVEVTKRIWWLPRAIRWSWHGNAWLGLGGAVSVDRVFLRLGVEWWPEEEISDAEAAAAAQGGHADVMVCHDRPAFAPLVLPPPPSAWRQGDLLRSEMHRQRLQAVTEHVKPQLLVHGHYHYEDDTVISAPWGQLHVTGLDRDDGPGANVRVLNTRTLAWVRPERKAA